MAQEIGNLAVSLSIDSAKFEQSLSSIDRNLRAMGQEIRSVQNKGKDWGNSIGGLTSKQDALTRMLDGQGTKVERLRVAYEKSKAETGENSKATENLAIQLNRAQAEYNKTETELAQVSAALAKQEAELKLAQSNWTKLGDSLTAVGDKMKSAGDKMKDIGKDLSMKVTAPIVAMGTLATKAAIDFESAFAGVRKTVDASEAEFAALEKGIRDMAKEIPASASGIAEVAEAAGQLGIEKENILAFSRTMIDLGEATNMTADVAATSFAQFANVVGMPQENFDRLGSSVVALGNNLATTEADIVSMAMRLSGVGAQVGLTEAEIMALSGTMASVGINAEAGGSAMSTVMKKISNAVADGGKDMEGFAKAANVSTAEFAKAWKNDPITALDAFIKGLGESGESGENLNAILADLGIKGIQETDTLLRLAGASELLGEAVDISTAAWEENSALTEEAAQRYATTESQLNIMKNKLVDLGIAIGSIIIPVLLQVVEAIEPWIAKLGELSESTQKTILVIAGIAAAIGPVLVILGTLFSSLGTIISAFGAVSTAVASAGGVIALIANPIGIAVAAIGTIIAAVVLAYNKLDWFRDGVNTIWEKIKEYTTIAFNAIKETITKVVSSAVDFAKGILDKFKVFWDENGKAIMTIVKLYFTGIQKTIELVMGAIKGVFQVVWPIITGIVKTAWELIKTHVQVGIDLVLGIIRTVMKVLQGDWKGAWNTIKETAQNIWKNIQDFFRNVDLIQIGKDMIRGLITGIKSMASAVVNSVKGVVNGAIQGAKNLLGIKSPSRVFLQIGDDTGQGLVDGINAKVKLVANAGKRLAGAVIQPLDSYSLPTSVTRSSGTNTGNSLSTTGNKGASGNGNEGPIIIKPAPIVLDGRVIGEAVFETIDQTMGSSSRLKNHMRGV